MLHISRYIIAAPQENGHSSWPSISINASDYMTRYINNNINFEKFVEDWDSSDICNKFLRKLLKEISKDVNTSKSSYFEKHSQEVLREPKVKIYRCKYFI